VRGVAHDGGFANRVIQPLLTLYMLHRMRKVSRDGKMTVGESLLFRNEAINLHVIFIWTCFPQLLDLINKLPLFSEATLIVFIWMLSEYHKKHNIPKSYFILWSVIAIASQIYIYTQHIKSLIIYHFHICGLIVYPASIILFVKGIFSKRSLDAAIPLTLIMFFLFKEETTKRWILLLINLQFMEFILPLKEHLQILFIQLHSARVLYSLLNC
jgi:hypothetical protein